MTWLRNLLVVVLCIACGPVNGSERLQVHNLSLRVLVDGQEVMAPTLQAVPGRTVQLQTKRQGRPDIGLEVDIEPNLTVQGESGIGLRFVLWKDVFNQRERLHDSALLLTPEKIQTAARAGVSPSVILQAPNGQKTEIQVISHSIAAAKVDAARDAAHCPATGGRAMADQAGIQRENHCCGAGCANGEDRHFSCCGAISCCDCGACCNAL